MHPQKMPLDTSGSSHSTQSLWMEIESVAEDYRTFDLAIADEVADRQNGFAEVD